MSPTHTAPARTLEEIQAAVNQRFETAFGRTPLRERIQDVLAQATALSRYADLDHLRDEAGDLLCSILQLSAECRWNPADLVAATLHKIEQRREQYTRLGRKLSVGLLGGAFDPVHRGHVEVAREAVRLGGLDEVWLLPCYEHLAGKQMTAPEHRLEMCRLAVRGERCVGVFDYEIRHRFRGETYHLIKRLLAEEVARLQCDFSLVIGQDNADQLDTWANGTGLERLIRFVVVPRPGAEAPRPSAWYLQPPHAYLERARLESPTSSTEVRHLLRSGAPGVERLATPAVLEYIRTHRLYAPPAAPAPAAKFAAVETLLSNLR